MQFLDRLFRFAMVVVIAVAFVVCVLGGLWLWLGYGHPISQTYFGSGAAGWLAYDFGFLLVVIVITLIFGVIALALLPKRH